MKREATEQVAFRLPRSLLANLDARVQSMRDAHPGMVVTRTDVVRLILTHALADQTQAAAKVRGQS